MYCAVCGNPLWEEARFCPNCGARVEGAPGVGTAEAPGVGGAGADAAAMAGAGGRGTAAGTAGFPCRAFSFAGQHKGFDDDCKGQLRGACSPK